MIGITAYGGYVPRLRLSRQAAAQANAWYAPQFTGRKGTRAFANWDEDSITLAVAAARDCLGPATVRDRSNVRALLLASDTLPFAERLNAGVVAGALALDEGIEAIDLGGTQRAALSAFTQAVARVAAHRTNRRPRTAIRRHPPDGPPGSGGTSHQGRPENCNLPPPSRRTARGWRQEVGTQ